LSDLSVEKEIRLYEQLLELAETYGMENIQKVLPQVASGLHVNEEKTKKVEIPQVITMQEKRPIHYREQIEQEKEAKEQVPKLPPNIKTIDEFIKTASQFQRDKIREYILSKLKYFIDNARLVQTGEFKKIDLNFILSLTEKRVFGDVVTPEEDWLEYNFDALRKQLKKKLRLVGYEFLDTDAEVGKMFDPSKHNCIGMEPVETTYKDKRILRVMSEGLIIQRVIHINADVIIGKYK